jgi:kynurenine formamidase
MTEYRASFDAVITFSTGGGVGAAWLADHGAALVGIDAINIDDTSSSALGVSRVAARSG